MPKLAFVVFEKESEKVRKGLIQKTGFFKKRIGTVVFQLLNKSKFKNGIHFLKMESGEEFLLIKMPFPLSRLPAFNRRYFERYISQICSTNDCSHCFVPDLARKLSGFEKYTLNANNRSIVFKALLLPILDEIYLKSDFRLDHLDTAFLNGENIGELQTMVKQLEPYMKYINVASPDHEDVEEGLSDICAESGISIYVSSDLKGIFKNADLLINLGKVAALSKVRIKPRSLVIDFSNGLAPKLHGEFTIITGVEYTFPQNQYDAMGDEVQRCFSRIELTEILMAFKAGLLNGGSYNDTTVALILNIFKKNGCKITGFNGRKGVLRVENVLKTINMKL